MSIYQRNANCRITVATANVTKLYIIVLREISMSSTLFLKSANPKITKDVTKTSMTPHNKKPITLVNIGNPPCISPYICYEYI